MMGNAPERIWIDGAMGGRYLTVSEDRDDCLAPHGPYVYADLAPAPRVKPLEWAKRIVDWAKPLPGMKYVACSTTPPGSWAWWLEEAPESRAVCASEKCAKAAAQADYEARILAALAPPEAS